MLMSLPIVPGHTRSDEAYQCMRRERQTWLHWALESYEPKVGKVKEMFRTPVFTCDHFLTA